MSNLHPRTARSRAALLDVAWTMIVDSGLEVGMAEIADAVGMTRQSVYVHFKSRAGLLIALVRRADEREQIHERFAAALTISDPSERLDAFLSEWLDFVTVVHPVARQLIAARQKDPGAEAAWSDRMDVLHAGFKGLAKGLKRDGALGPDWTAPQAADYLWANASVQVWELLSIDCGWGTAKTSRRLRSTLASTVLV